MGLTLTEYINQLRIVNSLPLIMSTDRSLLDIALSCGFNSYKTYNTAFKKLFHTTPYVWQKEQQLLHRNQNLMDETSSTFSFSVITGPKKRNLHCLKQKRKTGSHWS